MARISSGIHTLAALALMISAAARATDSAAPVVLTGLQATYSIASALTAGTAIKVNNIPADGRPLALQKDYLSRRADSLAAQFAAAIAVITTTNALPEDPLYRFAREANIRVVNIDAAIPWSLNEPGVALVESPRSNVKWGRDPDSPQGATAPYFWLSVSNAIRMADIVANDLAALFPESAIVIRRNLDALKRSLLQLRGDYQNRLIDTDGGVVFALTGDFVYLTNDMGLLVDGYFIKQDVRWSKADLAGLTRHLQDNHIKVVLHKWLPSEAIQDAVKAAGARVVVLEAGDPGAAVDNALRPDGLQRILRNDLEAIYTALK